MLRKETTNVGCNLEKYNLLSTPVDSNQYNTLYQTKASLAAQTEQFWVAIKATQHAAALNIMQTNAAITTIGVSDSNHKTVNQILLGMETGQPITPANLGILDAIALQCPTEGGDAVYEARAVAGYYLEKTYNDDACALFERKGQSSSASMVDQLKIYPNPANDILYWQQPSVEINEVLLYNALGQRVAQANGQTSMLHIAALPNGLYYIQFWSSNGVLIASKPVVVSKP